jgi:cytochrome c
MNVRIAIAAALAGLAIPAAAQTAGDAAMGKKQFGQCRVCHTVEANGRDGVGPNLFRSYGSRAATRRPKFAYSAALKSSKLTWDDATLDRWLTDPGATVKGSKMVFIGLPRKPVRQNIIAYLKTLK